MKTLLAIFSAAVILTAGAFTKDQDIKKLLEKPDTRREIINSILNNHEYMSEFIQAMHGNQHAMIMMNGNNQMMGNQGQMGMNGNGQMMGNQGQMGMAGNNQMMSQSSMMNMMHNNPGMMQMMMNNMMNTVATDTSMTNYMIRMMANNPQMLQMMIQHLGSMQSGTYSSGGMGMHQGGEIKK